MYCGLLSVMHRSDAYSSTSYSRGIRWVLSPEVCRMIWRKIMTTKVRIKLREKAERFDQLITLVLPNGKGSSAVKSDHYLFNTLDGSKLTVFADGIFFYTGLNSNYELMVNYITDLVYQGSLAI